MAKKKAKLKKKSHKARPRHQRKALKAKSKRSKKKAIKSVQNKPKPAAQKQLKMVQKQSPSAQKHLIVKQKHPGMQKHVSVYGTAHSKSSGHHHSTRGVVSNKSGSAVCREVACELMATTGNYCRLHYIKNWKKVKRKEMILKERKLNHYIEELVSKYPDKYIEAIRQDLASEKDFAKVISDLEIEENLDDFEVETEGAEGIIDNLKRDFEDDEDLY